MNREVSSYDKAKDIIPEIIGTHPAPEGIGNVPELLFELLFFCHIF